MIGYVTLGTSDVTRARGFYDELLSLLGAKRLMEFGEELGGFTMWGVAMDKPALVVTMPYNQQPAHSGNGNMVALTVDDRALVDALHAKAIALGGSCDGPPGLREPVEMQFYAAYFRDPDGNKLCAFQVGPAD
jgi:catechol 2,3-dioxygenase-like lactoylglutathione lyase family enzyme